MKLMLQVTMDVISTCINGRNEEKLRLEKFGTRIGIYPAPQAKTRVRVLIALAMKTRERVKFSYIT